MIGVQDDYLLAVVRFGRSENQRVILVDRVHAGCDPYEPGQGFIKWGRKYSPKGSDILMEEWML